MLNDKVPKRSKKMFTILQYMKNKPNQFVRIEEIQSQFNLDVRQARYYLNELHKNNNIKKTRLLHDCRISVYYYS